MREVVLLVVAALVGCSSSENGGTRPNEGGYPTPGWNADSGRAPSNDDAADPEDTDSPAADAAIDSHVASDAKSPTDTAVADAPAAGDIAAARALCVKTINDYRATLGLPPYADWSDVDTCVDGEAKADFTANKPHSAFGTCGEHAQNECPDWPHGPSQLVAPCLKDMWNEGPGTDFEAHGHYINMSSTKYTKVSCGFYQTPTGHWWATQDFR